jgi:hypothetical protein
MSPEFMAGILVGVVMMGFVHLAAMMRVRAADREFRFETKRRIDAIGEWSARQYEQSRKEIGLPPRRTS